MSNDWISWSGGECPLEEDDEVWIRYDNGWEGLCKAADNVVWQHHDGIPKITAYRIPD